jgi:hypothetical protein
VVSFHFAISPLSCQPSSAKQRVPAGEAYVPLFAITSLSEFDPHLENGAANALIGLAISSIFDCERVVGSMPGNDHMKSRNFHESYVQGEIKPPSERMTGLMFGAVAMFVAMLWPNSPVVPWIALIFAVGLTAVGLFASTLLKPLNIFWFRFGLLLHRLVRSCQSFSSLASAAKPRFESKDGHLVSPRAVPTPYENYLRHREKQTLDTVLAKLYSVRVLALAMGPFLRGTQETCIAKLNAALLSSLMNDTPQKTRIHLIHLDGVLPAEFLSEMAALNIPYYSAPSNIAATSRVIPAGPQFLNCAGAEKRPFVAWPPEALN